MKFENLVLVTLEDFKNEVELWKAKGFPQAVEARFEDGDLVLVIPDYCDPERLCCISVPFNENALFCLDKDFWNID